MLIVQACEFIATGDGYYRMHEPMQLLGTLPGVIAVDCHIASRHFWSLARDADVLILPFFNNWDLFPEIESRRRNGKVTVFETNDYFLDLQPWNPIAEHWLDPDIRALHLNLIEKCDAVQTSTKRLAEHWKNRAKKIATFDNYLSVIPPLLPEPKRPLTIGWAGSQGHLADWYVMTRVLQPWLDQHPEIHVAVMGNAAAKDFLRLPPERYHFETAGDLDKYLAFLPHLDIGLAPLLPTEYNRCRSDIKFLEYAVHGIAGIYSKGGPYDATIVEGKTGLLANTFEAMIPKLNGLIEDPARRSGIRKNAYTYAAKKRKFSDHIAERATFYRELLGKNPVQTELPVRYSSVAVKNGNYYRIGHDALSNSVQEILPKQDAAAALILNQAIAQDGEYLVAYQAFGKLLNTQKRPLDALTVLEGARKLSPHNSQTLSEIGRAYFLNGNPVEARSFMMRALEQNPLSISAWSYFLRFCAINPQLDIAEIIAQLKKSHPISYSLWSDAAALLSPQKACELLIELLSTVEKENQMGRDFAAKALLKPIVKTVQRAHQERVVLDLLKLSTKLFPKSLLLADSNAQILRNFGKHAESDREYQRAFELESIVLQIRQEFASGQEVNQMRQIGLHLEHLNHVIKPSR